MTRYRINLATQPYEDTRRFYMTWGAVLVIVALFTAALSYAAVTAFLGWQISHQKIKDEQAQIAKLDAQQQEDLTILNKPENRDVRAKSQFINGLIHRKEFSWTKIFADMEKLMPTRLHVVSITPQLDQDDHIHVHMVVAGDAREKGNELLQRMEKSKSFRQPELVAESTNAAQGNGPREPYKAEITALYVPQGSQGEQADETAAKPKDKAAERSGQ